jgi:hypothetical protein
MLLLVLAALVWITMIVVLIAHHPVGGTGNPMD